SSGTWRRTAVTCCARAVATASTLIPSTTKRQRCRVIASSTTFCAGKSAETWESKNRRTLEPQPVSPLPNNRQSADGFPQADRRRCLECESGLPRPIVQFDGASVQSCCAALPNEVRPTAILLLDHPVPTQGPSG